MQNKLVITLVFTSDRLRVYGSTTTPRNPNLPKLGLIEGPVWTKEPKSRKPEDLEESYVGSF